MHEVFADCKTKSSVNEVNTAGWMNFFIRTEPYHRKAVALMRQWRQQGRHIITTNYVRFADPSQAQERLRLTALNELVALFTSPLHVPRPLLVRYIETIKNASYVEIIHIDKELDVEVWTLLRERLDKEWTLVDRASFVKIRVFHLRSFRAKSFPVKHNE